MANKTEQQCVCVRLESSQMKIQHYRDSRIRTCALKVGSAEGSDDGLREDVGARVSPQGAEIPPPPWAASAATSSLVNAVPLMSRSSFCSPLKLKRLSCDPQ